MSTTRLHELSQPLSKTRNSFVLRKKFSMFSPEQLLIRTCIWLQTKFSKSFVRRSPDMISVGVQFCRYRWPLFLLNRLQTVRVHALLSDTFTCVQSPMHLAESTARTCSSRLQSSINFEVEINKQFRLTFAKKIKKCSERHKTCALAAAHRR